MCILPNLLVRDLEELAKRRKNMKKTEAETVKVIAPSCKSLEKHNLVCK
jgi:hypothetical protein